MSGKRYTLLRINHGPAMFRYQNAMTVEGMFAYGDKPSSFFVTTLMTINKQCSFQTLTSMIAYLGVNILFHGDNFRFETMGLNSC